MSELEDVFIESIYGAKTKQGIVQVQFGEFKQQWTILSARKIAHMILEAANKAELDETIFEFFQKFFAGKPEGMQMVAMLMQELRKNQGRNDPRIFED